MSNEKKWSDDEDIKLKSLRASGYSIKEISEILNRTESSTSNRLYRLKIKKHNAWTKEEMDVVIELYPDKTISTKSIGEKLGRTDREVVSKARELGLSRGVFIKHPKNLEFFKVWTHAMAYSVGFIAGDGNIRKNSVHISLSKKDVEVLEFIRDNVSPLAPIRYIKHGREEADFVLLTIDSQEIVQDLYKLGLDRDKSKSIRLPDNISMEFFYSYLLGLFDADGCMCVTTWSKVDFVGSSESYFNDIREIIQKDIGVDLRPRSMTTYFTLSTGKRSSIIKLYEKMYENSPFCLKRKKDKFEKFIKDGNNKPAKVVRS